MPIAWTNQNVTMLKALWAEGFSGAQIAARIVGVSRNAVIGKIHRLGLSGRATTTRLKQTRRGPRKIVLIPAVAKRAPTSTPFVISSNPRAKLQPEPLPTDELTGVTTAEHTDCMCSWIKNDPRAGAIWCPEVKVPGKSYCGAHLARAVPLVVMRRPTAPSVTTAAVTASRSLREIVNAG